jgi:hypothetical protein
MYKPIWVMFGSVNAFKKFYRISYRNGESRKSEIKKKFSSIKWGNVIQTLIIQNPLIDQSEDI